MQNSEEITNNSRHLFDGKRGINTNLGRQIPEWVLFGIL